MTDLQMAEKVEMVLLVQVMVQEIQLVQELIRLLQVTELAGLLVIYCKDFNNIATISSNGVEGGNAKSYGGNGGRNWSEEVLIYLLIIISFQKVL